MYTVEFLDATGGVQERIVLGFLLADAFAADLQAKSLFEGVRVRKPSVVGYRVLNNDGEEVARFWPVHA
jgi:hypothetical protein